MPGENFLLVDSITISRVSNLLGKDWKKMGRELGIPEPELEYIELDKRVYGSAEMAYQVVNRWSRRSEEEPMVHTLVKHLMKIGRKDIVKEIKRTQANDSNSLQIRQEKTIGAREDAPSCCLFPCLRFQTRPILLNQIQAKLKDEYQRLQLHGLPWMQDIEITLADYYVALSMIQQDKRGIDLPEKTVDIEQTFETLELSKKPSRILVEGGPGYGKTTLACKLCYDYACKVKYIKHFDLVLMLPLRYFTGNLKKLLQRSSRTCEENIDGLFEIVNDEKVKTLIILDGFDEVPKQHLQSLLPLIRGDNLTHLTVVVTSRPGQFTSQIGGIYGFQIFSDASIGEKLFDKRIKIMGIDQSLLEEFVVKHTPNLSDYERILLIKRLGQIMANQVMTENLIQCPLFLLMVILLLTESEDSLEQNLHTKTGLYQQIMSFVIQRYSAKIGHESAASVHLFSYDFAQKCVFKDLMIQFGQFAFEAVTTGKLSFTREEIVGPAKARDDRIADLGLLTSTVSIKGLRTKVHFEPVHRSLLEFAAAYSLVVEFKDRPGIEWEQNVCKVRPKIGTSSLLFPFLSGLMGKDAHILYNALGPYSADYSYDFDSLESSLIEVPMTPTFLSSLLPLLPIHLVVRQEKALFSTHFSQIIHFWLENRKIKQVELNTRYPISFCENVEIDELILYYTEEIVFPITKKLSIDLRCKDLYCMFSCPIPSENIWSNFLALISSIKFRGISLLLNRCGAFYLPLFRSAILAGPLREANIRFISLNYGTDNFCGLMSLAELIQNDRLRGISLDAVKPDPSSSRSLCKEDCQGCESLLPQCISNLVACASKSSRLKYFVLGDMNVDVTVDLATLCDNGYKSWKSVRSGNVQFTCTREMQNTNMQIKNFEARSSDLPNSVSNQLKDCQITAIFPNSKFMDRSMGFLTSYEHLTAIRVKFDDSIFHHDFFPSLSKLPNLQILSFQLSQFDYRNFPFSAGEWIMTSLDHSFNLRSIELFYVELNPLLAVELVQAIAKLLQGIAIGSSDDGNDSCPSSSITPQPKKFKLHDLMLQTNLNPDPTKLSPSSLESVSHFISLVAAAKESLTSCRLARLDVVVKGNRMFLCASVVLPGFSSIYDIFSPTEGFKIKHELWAMNKDDSIQSRYLRKFLPLVFYRFSIAFKTNS